MMAARKLFPLRQQMGQVATPAGGVGFIGLNEPASRAASKTASVRPRTREAVTGFIVQIGCRTASTSSVVIALIGIDNRRPAYVLSGVTHCVRTFSLRHS